MSFATTALQRPRPASVRDDLSLPRRQRTFASPVDWRDEILYFLLVDRFSDAGESARPLLDRDDRQAARPPLSGGSWRWDAWAHSGADRWQGGTLNGVRSKLGYLARLGATCLWLSPVFKQRGHLDTYHGYGVQDFLDIDPHVGTRSDLVELVTAAHHVGIRVILDVIFNHSGSNWTYPPGTPGGEEEPVYTPGRYPFGSWRGDQGQRATTITGPDDGAWPREFQDPDAYTRAGSGDLGAGDLDDATAEHKRTDFLSLRDFLLSERAVLSDLARCCQYWIALTDCDGFRIDTLKHVAFDEGRNLCGAIKEFAANIGKENFFLAGEIAGGDYAEDRYLTVIGQNLNAALDIGAMRLALRDVAKGLRHPDDYFSGFDPGRAVMGSHRNLGNRHVAILDDHDHVFGEKVRFSSDAASEHQVVAGVALQLFTLGIPCLYYGTEQAFAGPEPGERRWLYAEGWGSSDRFLREAMFGPLHPRLAGRAGLAAGSTGVDPDLPGFGPFGTAGSHCFDERHPAFVRIAAMTALRREFPTLRHGRQYPRPLAILDGSFEVRGPGELIAWSRILNDEETLCVVNSHGTEPRGGSVLVDADLNATGASLAVVLNTAQTAAGAAYNGSHAIGSAAPILRSPAGIAYVALRDIGASEVLVLATHPRAETGAVR
jgi:glycosidase